MIEAHHEPTCLVGGDYHTDSQFPGWNPLKKDHTFTVDKFAQCIAKHLNQEHMKEYCASHKVPNCESTLEGQIKDQRSNWVGRVFSTCKHKYNVDDGVITGSQNVESNQQGSSSSVAQTGGTVNPSSTGGGATAPGTVQGSKKSFSASSLTSLVVINKRYTRNQLMSFI